MSLNESYYVSMAQFNEIWPFFAQCSRRRQSQLNSIWLVITFCKLERKVNFSI